MLRTLRAAIVIGIFWALAWLPVGAALALYAGLSPPQPSDILYRPVDGWLFLSVWTAWGGLSGTAFALLLSAVERRRTLAELSLTRTALWGALGAMSAPAVLTMLDILRGQTASPIYDWRPSLISLALSAMLGAVCGAATLVSARRPTR
ncbi:MAG: hypothetical protein OEW06_11560 [Gemmatimonadota bacterium]|nr:hypothetical protein [Gemmatimonadota bacterium]